MARTSIQPDELDVAEDSPRDAAFSDPQHDLPDADLELEPPCVGDFLHSPCLQEYKEQREAGLVSYSLYDLPDDISDVWALAVGPSKATELKNQYSRFGVLIEHNFADFASAEGCTDAFRNATIDEIAFAKAKAVYDDTGMPAIAEFSDMTIEPPKSGSNINKTMQQGYYTRLVDTEGDAMIDRVRPISDANRMAIFKSAVAYYDGEMHVVVQRAASVAMAFASAYHVTIAIASALDELFKQLSRRLNLTFDSPENSKWRAEDGEGQSEGKRLVGATMLKERLLREGKMLSDNIIKVSSFVNHKVDTELMEVCGEELAERLRHTMPNKILTVESTGLIAGLPTARTLGIPLVFARKSRPITISDSYQTTYRSATKGTMNELIVSCEYLEAGDRVLIIDDFLAGGSTAEALFKLAKMAHAKVVGVGVLIEKMMDGGRAFLSGYDVPVESLAKILPAGDRGRIMFVEEEAWVPPFVKKQRSEGEQEGEEGAGTERSMAMLEEEDEDEEGEEGEEDVGVIRWEDEEEEGVLDELEENLIREHGRR